MTLSFLIDEDVPVALIRWLVSKGFDAVRVEPRTPDSVVIVRAEAENRLVITLDKDFQILAASARCPIILLQLHPPAVPDLVEAVSRLLTLPASELRGLIILRKTDWIRLAE